MKILHLLQSAQFSGAENVACQIIGMFNEFGIRMAYCSTDGSIKEELRRRNIEYYPLKKLSISEVKRVIKEYNPDVIHAHDMRASFIAAVCCGEKTLISHIHNNSFQSRGFSVKSIAYILAGTKAKHIFWVSKSSFEGYLFKNFFKNKSSVLQNIIDMEALYEKKNEDVNKYNYDIVYVGRLTYQKNPERLLDVLERVCNKCENVRIAIVGSGDLEEKVKKICYDKNLGDNIEFLGYCTNPLKIVYDSKVMIMTSRWEGTPICALEAQSLGVPIVTTPTDGLCDIISDGINGYLSEENDVLAEKICEILSNAELQKKMSIVSEKMMKKTQNKEIYMGKLKEVYEN